MSMRPNTIGAYRVLGPLGQGGMGVVYRAEHLRTGQRVALKTVRLPHAGLLQSIRREIHALARIRHPGVVRILDEGLHDGLPWYAMELLEGITLRQWQRRLDGAAEGSCASDTPRESQTTRETEVAPWWTRTLDVGSGGTTSSASAAEVRVRQEAGQARPRVSKAREELRVILTVVRRLCSPLAYLHGEGLVHQDLKPDNILLRADGARQSGVGSQQQQGASSPSTDHPSMSECGWPVLVDFGLAAPFAGELSREALSVAAGSAGTLAYMAPEQIRGELLDARADLYALGCILYELLAGRLPFVAGDRRLLHELCLHAEPLAPSSHEPAVPEALDELILRLLAKEPRDRLGHADDVAAALAELGAEAGVDEAGPRPRAYLYRPGFAGREQQLEVLRRQLDDLEQGRGGIVLVGGESGVGKTRLVMELGREAASRGIQVLTGGCLGVGGKPLEPLRKPLQALCDRCREGGMAEADRIFGDRGPVLRPYEPAIGQLTGQDAYGALAELPAKDALLRLYHCLGETLLAAAARSVELLLLLDDLQWADELTVGFLEYLARTGGAQRSVLLLGTYRTEEVGADRDAPLRRLIDAPGIKRILLGRLEEAGVAAMVADMLALVPPPAAFSRFLAEQSEGSPFFVAEYLRAAVAEGLLWRDTEGRWEVAEPEAREAVAADYAALPLPRSLRELVGRRLEGLAHTARQLAEAAAVLGRETGVPVLRQMTGLEETEMYSATDELLRRQVMEEAGGGRLRFVHDKIREVAYERLDDAGRPVLHRAAAEAMEAVVGDERQEQLGELGRHWEAAGELRKAAECYLPAARAAVARSANEEAERLYRAYLRLVEQPSVESIVAHNELGVDVLGLGGRNDEALGEHEKALSEARGLGQRALEGETLRRSSRVHQAEGRMEEATRRSELALAIFGQIGDRPGQGAALGNLANLHWEQGQLEEARQLYEQALTIHRDVGDRRFEGIVLGNLATLHLGQGRLEEARQLYEQALTLHREVGDRRFEGIALGNLATLLQELGRYVDARQLYEQALSILRQVGDRRFEGIALSNLGDLHQEQGRLGEAQQIFEQALAIHGQINDRRYGGRTLGNLATLHQEQGRLEDARELYEQALAIYRQVGDQCFEGFVLGGLANLTLLGAGDLSQAAKLAEEAVQVLAAVGDQVELARVHCCQGHIELAAGRSGWPPLERAEALASAGGAGADSRIGKAVSRLRRAVTALEAGQQDQLLHGYLPGDLPEGLRRRLEQGGPVLP